MARKKGRRATPLTPEQQRFVDEYLIDLNGTQAYRRVYPECTYQTARSEAARFLAKPSIKAEIKAARMSERKRLRVTSGRVTAEIARIAFSDPFGLEKSNGDICRIRDIPIDLRKAIASVKVRRVKSHGDDDVTVDVIEYKLWNKLDALGKLAKRLGLETEITPLDSLLGLLPAKLREQVVQALAEGVRPGSGEEPHDS